MPPKATTIAGLLSNPSRYNSFCQTKSRANQAIRPHTHKIPLDVTRVSSHLGVSMPVHMTPGLCGGVRHATQLEYRAECIQDAEPEYWVKRIPHGATRGSCYSWYLRWKISLQLRRLGRASRLV